MAGRMIKIGSLCSIERKNIKPEPGTIYRLYSLPAFDNKETPEIIDGKDIMSSKLAASSHSILFNKLNVKFRRVWNLHKIDEKNAICSGEFIPLKINTDQVNQDYLYYNLISDSLTKTMHAARKGTSNSQQRIDPKVLMNYEILLPSIEEQNKIVSVLLSFDDLIKTNNELMKNLEKQEHALYKHYFVECLSDDNLPNGWKTVSLSELMDYQGGNQPPAKEFINEYRDGYIRFVQIRDYENDEHITYIPISKKNKLCYERDIMIARYGASLGRICYGIDGAYNVALAKVYPKKEIYREFLRCYLSSYEFYEGINNKGGRSAQAGFNQSDIDSFVVPFPNNDSLVQEFDKIASLIFEKRLQCLKFSRILTSLKKNVLEKIIKKELDINKL